MLDISIDLRPHGQLGYVHVEELCGQDNKALMIPGFIAHGVIVLENDTTFMSISPQPHSPGDERGISCNTLGIDFGISNPLVTEKNKSLPPLIDVINLLE
jgi:dTDP-4-dehydrorhamnose 3,5-epimerase-like enzyme